VAPPEPEPEVEEPEEPTSLPEGERWDEPVVPAKPVNEPIEPDGTTAYEDDES
jgi:hypothetical protein